MSDTFVINTDPPTDFTIYPPPMPLMRQIGEHKWWAGVSYLQHNTDKNEVVVGDHYSGWKYILARTSENNTFTQKTYNGDRLIWTTTMKTQ